MHTLIFLATYATLYNLCDFGRLWDGLEIPPVFFGVLYAFVVYDLVKLGVIKIMYKMTDEDKDELAGRITNALCFTCGAQMRIRLAKKGKNAGSLFLGCSNFPNCRGSAEMPEDIADLFEEDTEEEFMF